MAWETINHKCGHTQRVQLYGPGVDRESKKEWMETKDCPDCWREQKEKDRKEENERASALASEIGFTPLSGSDKQVAWANTIRQKTYEDFAAANQTNATKFVPLINAEKLARWWIDNREESTRGRMYKLAASYPNILNEIKQKESANETM